MIIWSGWGILVPFVIFGVGATIDYFLRDFAGSNVAPFLGYTIAAAAVWFLGNKINSGKGQVVIDKETRKEIVLKKTSTFFFIPFQYWAVAAGLIALYTLFFNGR